MEPAGSQDYLGKVTPKKRRDSLWEMNDHRMRSQRQGKGKMATAVFWRAQGSKRQSWGDQKKNGLCAPLALGTAPSVCESHWTSLFPLIPIHTRTGNLLLPPSTMTTVVLVAEICAMDFSVSSTADSISQQTQRCQKYADEILVFFFISIQLCTTLMISILTFH